MRVCACVCEREESVVYIFICVRQLESTLTQIENENNERTIRNSRL